LNISQKALFFRQAAPAVAHRDAPPVRQRESGDVERVAEGMLGNVRMGVPVHAAA
jgi:hypothetical protein